MAEETIEELIESLREIASWSGEDPEDAHVMADALLLRYIGDERVKAAFDEIERWYA